MARLLTDYPTVYPRDLADSFGADSLVGQFILCRDARVVPKNWPTAEHEAWILGVHPKLPRVDVYSPAGTSTGFLLGHPIRESGVLVTKTLVMDSRHGYGASAFETMLDGFGGRFVGVCIGDENPRVYLDAFGSLSVVYAPMAGIVCSTPALIPYSGETGDDRDLIEAVGLPASNAMFPLELTPRRGVLRLLPNHYLDLQTWQAVRHWPTGGFHSPASIDETAIEVGDIIRRNIEAVVCTYRTYMALTAGRDSRMLLSCARRCLDNIECYTTSIPYTAADVDCAVARRVAAFAGVDHLTLRFKRATDTELREWLYRVGCSAIAFRGWQSIRSERQKDPSRAVLISYGAEIARDFYWKHFGFGSVPVNAERLLRTIGVPISEQTMEVARTWLEHLPADEWSTVLGLFYIEQRLGCWGGVTPYATAPYHLFILFPMCHRRIAELLLGLPIEYRRKGLLAIDVMRHMWPELLSIPLNRPTGMSRVRLAIKRRVLQR